MASNLIVTFQTKADTTGVDQIAKGMENMRAKMQETAKASSNVGSTFTNLKNVLVGTVLTLPLTGFIKEAIASEEVTSRFSMQLKSLGQSINDLDMDTLTKKAHQFGITQTELIEALSRGLPYFKSTRNELALLDTAIGMTRYSGASLSTAFQQLGYIMQYGATRVARQYGVSLHTDIHDASQRGALVIADLTEKMKAMAGQTGTTSEKLRAMSATIKDAGEKFAANFLRPIAAIADSFNKLSPVMQEVIVNGVLLATTLVGIGAIAVGLKGAFAALGAGGILGALGLSNPSIALIAAIAIGLGALYVAYTKFIELQEKASASKFEFNMSALKARASDASTAIGLEEKFSDKVQETERVVTNLNNKLGIARDAQMMYARRAADEQDATIKGILEQQAAIAKGSADKVQAELESAMAIRNSQKKEATEQGLHNIETLDEYQKFQYRMAELRIMAMREGSNKELAELRLKMSKERDDMIKMYGDALDVRLALTKAEIAQEAALRKKAIDDELNVTLMSTEEKLKYDKDYADAKSALAGLTETNLATASDATKELVKNTEGGKKALEEWTKVEAQRQAQLAKDYPTLYKIMQMEKGVYEEEPTVAKDLKSFTSEEKAIAATASITSNVTINITPKPAETAKEAGKNVEDEINKQWNEDVAKRVFLGMPGGVA